MPTNRVDRDGDEAAAGGRSLCNGGGAKLGGKALACMAQGTGGGDSKTAVGGVASYMVGCVRAEGESTCGSATVGVRSLCSRLQSVCGGTEERSGGAGESRGCRGEAGIGDSVGEKSAWGVWGQQRDTTRVKG